MIVDKNYGLWILLRETALPLGILALWDLVVVILYQVFHQEWMEQPALPISLMGSALALFLGVRNNAAYARWWEGRSLWGLITNNSRSFAREAATLLGGARILPKPWPPIPICCARHSRTPSRVRMQSACFRLKCTNASWHAPTNPMHCSTKLAWALPRKSNARRLMVPFMARSTAFSPIWRMPGWP